MDSIPAYTTQGNKDGTTSSNYDIAYRTEEALISGLTINSDDLLEISQMLSPDDFLIQRLAWIYEAMLALFRRGEPIDLVTLAAELNRQGWLEKLGGHSFLTGLTAVAQTGIHNSYYAGEIKNLAHKRRLLNIAQRTAYLAGNGTSGQETQAEVEELLFSLSRQYGHRDAQPVKAVMGEILDQAEHILANPDMLLGLPTGLASLDKVLGGLQKSNLIYLAGRPGMGKTSLGLQFGYHAAKNYGARVLFCSYEMSAKELGRRLLAFESGIETQRIRNAEMDDKEWPKLAGAVTALEGLPLWIDDRGGPPARIRAQALLQQVRDGLDLLIVDYIQLLPPDKLLRNRQYEVEAISRALKSLAVELDVPVLVMSQLSRECEKRADKRPTLSDLRDSGALEQDANVVIFLYRDEMYNSNSEYPGVAEIHIAKHRDGPTGTVSAFFKKEMTRFFDLKKEKKPLEWYRRET